MRKRLRKRDYLRRAGIFVGLLLLLLLIYVNWLLNRVPPGHTKHVDQYKLSMLDSAVIYYYIEYGEIPPEGELKRLFIERNVVEDETAFKSHAGLEIRYFTSENRLALVAPGANGRYDTPEGYEAVEEAEDTGDDFVRFGRVLRKREDRNEQKDKVGANPVIDGRDDREGERETGT